MKKQIYLTDLTHKSKLGLGSDTMPLQLGLIGSYCLKKHGDRVDVKIFKFVDEFVEAVKEQPPFIIGSSNYMWNVDLTSKLVGAIKKKYPETITIFGGPNYSDNFVEQVGWLNKHPEADFYIFKDGEIPFSRLVGYLLDNPDISAVKKERLPSCHSLVNDEPNFGKLEERLQDLSVIPSPYTTGLLDKFFDQKLLPMIQTNRGCPFTCTYCSEGDSYYQKVRKNSLKHKIDEIDYIASNVKHTKSLCITDSNFGMFKEDVDFCKHLGEVQKVTGYPEYLSCSTGKNQKERVLKCNELLGGIMRFAASVQSLDKDVLKNIRRTNISLEEIMGLSDQVSDTDTHSYSEIILGLPGDSLKIQKESIAKLMQTGISNITQHQLSLVYGTEVALPESRERFGIKGKFRPVQRCAGIYTFDGKPFTTIETEEIVVETNTMPFEDYMEARKFYLTTGLFYNDRIFGEIHSLLRLLKLPTGEWIESIHNNISKGPKEIRAIYEDFTEDTKNELWENRDGLVENISGKIEKYVGGEIGGNLIYKYRSQSIAKYFEQLHEMAFTNLRNYIGNKGADCDDAIDEIEQFSKYQKTNLFNTDFQITDSFNYDIIKMIKDPLLARRGGSLADVHYPVDIHIAHTAEQKKTILRQLDFHGRDINGLTLLLSRFPIKRFYRTANVVTQSKIQ